MSYLEVRLAAGPATEEAALSDPPPDRDGGLGELEWDIVEIARVDGPRGSNPDSLGTLLLRKPFGIATVRPLANERLKGLRRFAVNPWSIH